MAIRVSFNGAQIYKPGGSWIDPQAIWMSDPTGKHIWHLQKLMMQLNMHSARNGFVFETLVKYYVGDVDGTLDK